MTQKNALGKGLSALLGETKTKTISSSIDFNTTIKDIAIKDIRVNPFQPRRDFDQDALELLSESIKTHGIIQPLTLRRVDGEVYELISGERRLQAAKLANLSHIPGYIRTADDLQMLEMALVENIHRENLNPIEIALSYQRLVDECNISSQTIATRFGKDRATVANYIRLLKLPPEIQIGLRENALSMGHARAIITIDSTEVQLQIFREIVEKDLSVRKVESRVRELLLSKSVQSDEIVAQDSFLVKSLAQKFSEILSSDLKANVKISATPKGSGEIKIKFKNTEELKRLYSIIQSKSDNDHS